LPRPRRRPGLYLRFTDGSHIKDAATASSFIVELWARVSGTNGTTADEGLTNSYIEILSTQTGGGAIASGGISVGAWRPASTKPAPALAAPPRSMPTASPTGARPRPRRRTRFYMLARNATVGGASAGATLGAAVRRQHWEFKLATFTIDVGSVGGGTTSFNVVQPNAKAVVGAQTYATAKVDNATFSVTSVAPGTTYTGSTGVTFKRSPNRRASACWARLPLASWAPAASKRLSVCGCTR
jgi:hypothetical protein